jgi:hypothetical protein
MWIVHAYSNVYARVCKVKSHAHVYPPMLWASLSLLHNDIQFWYFAITRDGYYTPFLTGYTLIKYPQKPRTQDNRNIHGNPGFLKCINISLRTSTVCILLLRLHFQCYTNTYPRVT